jgi:hypothetical protein
VKLIRQVEWAPTSEMVHELEVINHYPMISTFTSYIGKDSL